VAPLVWRHRRKLTDLSDVRGHLARVAFNSAALTINFAAFAVLPLALVTAIGFTRPLVLLVIAALMLGERVSRTRYVFTALGFLGVIVMVKPDAIPWNMGLLAAFGSVFFGSLAVVQTRRLAGENTVILMLFYTVGLTLLTSIPAAVVWVPIPWSEAPNIVLVGVLAQLGQYCWLRAYQQQEGISSRRSAICRSSFRNLWDGFSLARSPPCPFASGAAIVVLTTVLATPAERWLTNRNKA
jgi:S-adenosylmethionine uptake transporter